MLKQHHAILKAEIWVMRDEGSFKQIKVLLKSLNVKRLKIREGIVVCVDSLGSESESSCSSPACAMVHLKKIHGHALLRHSPSIGHIA